MRSAVDEEMPGLLLGAGTILTVLAAEAYAEAGADFLVSPVAAADVHSWCQQHEVPFIPGVMTATELVAATSKGASLVKLFPAADLGPGYLRHLLGPLPGSRIMVTGGIRADRQEIRSWLEAGASAVGVGSDLVPSGKLSSSRLHQLTASCQELLEAVAAVRPG